ncbi:transposable element Tcb2 transposase [Trichonephila clavipes]|nr:transposable element Tcb2 transposase [Trichonephila clavipes]
MSWEQRIKYNQSNNVERQSYGGGGMVIWVGVSLGGHTDLSALYGGTLTGVKFWNEIYDRYVHPYGAAIDSECILMYDNA